MGATYDEIRTKLEEPEIKARLAVHFNTEKTYRFTVTAFGRSFTKEEKIERMEHFK